MDGGAAGLYVDVRGCLSAGKVSGSRSGVAEGSGSVLESRRREERVRAAGPRGYSRVTRFAAAADK